MKTTRREFGAQAAAAAVVTQTSAAATAAIDIGGRRELFIDDFLIDRMQGVRLELGRPVDAGVAIRFDKPWEGPFSAYTTVVHDGGIHRMYYRGVPESGKDGNESEVTCTAESNDGITWRRPELSLYDARGTKPNNVILAGQAPLSHNFSPFLDARPGVPPSERYKALAGIHKTGLVAFVSADGLAWRRLRDQAVFPSPDRFSLDSQNVSFWSESEGRYLLYFRTWKQIGKTNYRWVSRSTSQDFVNWSKPEEMDFGSAPPEHLYTSQTSPYFRAPHIYMGICARFMPGRQVLTEDQAQAVGVDPKYFKDCSDAVLITTRGAASYRRQFMEAFLRPGVGWENWVSRSNYPALNLVQTGLSTMSFYVNRNYGQPTSYLRRYELRLDGLASVHAGYAAGELLTKPLRFQGAKLELNLSTSAPGGVRVEVQDAAGSPLPGFSLDDSIELIGDEIARVHTWKGADSLASLAGRAVRLRFLIKDADLYSFRFTA
ncbi:MAG TPA: hypothetical protein PKJ41_03695 [Bryobacteraceae bacterium]|nr:hypothetical protein [Bryobacteraceae bacterium]